MTDVAKEYDEARKNHWQLWIPHAQVESNRVFMKLAYGMVVRHIREKVVSYSGMYFVDRN